MTYFIILLGNMHFFNMGWFWLDELNFLHKKDIILLIWYVCLKVLFDFSWNASHYFY